jgi:hypothetical protein
MISREEQLTRAKQRALSCVDMGHFSDAVAGLRAHLDENPLTKGVVSSDQARRGYKARRPGYDSNTFYKSEPRLQRPGAMPDRIQNS